MDAVSYTHLDVYKRQALNGGFYKLKSRSGKNCRYFSTALGLFSSIAEAKAVAALHS